jgi:DNA-binding transcriptional ArsR family regulator
MTSTQVSDDVRAFLREHIESYEQLEVLLLLQRESLHPWTADSLGVRLHVAPSVLGEALISLRGRRLVESSFDGGEEHYRLAADVAGNETLGRVATLYASHAVEIIKLMSAHSIERIRTAALRAFADAFVFRKDKRNG